MKQRNMHKQLIILLQHYASAYALYVHKTNNVTEKNMELRARELQLFLQAHKDQAIVNISVRTGIYA